MSGVHMRFTLRDTKMRADTKGLLRRLKDTDPFLKSIGEEMMPRIGKRFKEERGPDGKRWAPLSSRTIVARLKRYGNSSLTILRMRGHLAGSINYQVGRDQLKIGTGDEVSDYAGIHQFGGKAGRNRKVKIKARPYLGFADEDMDVIEEEAVSYFLGE